VDVADDGSAGGEEELIPRLPRMEDLVALCRRLNELGARYVVIGGFAINISGLARVTGDVDLLMDVAPENEALVFKALESLPDKAVLELDPGDVAKYTVVRVADDIIVDLMQSACGIEYAAAEGEIVLREVGGITIPFASPRLLWRMKAPTRRAKDAADLVFLREYFRQRGEEPPRI
jgi:hypothetical protein